MFEPDISKIMGFLKNKNIRVLSIRHHAKASESYVDVIFSFPSSKRSWEGAVPYEYRRTGVSCQNESEIATLLEQTYVLMDVDSFEPWWEGELTIWKKRKADITFDIFKSLHGFNWTCQKCGIPNNPNWARRFQDIKELGYTTSTFLSKFCNNCKDKTTHLLLLPIPRGHATGYENWSAKLRDKIIKTLGGVDAYENRMNACLLPDHKFPEIRWDKDTREENPDDMDEHEIRGKFQLLSNQRNQEKREACRNCYQSGKRGTPFGIRFFYTGDENWPQGIPTRGKEAEKGCVGCGWYDLIKWRKELDNKVTSK